MLKQKIQGDLKEAMKGKDEIRVSVLRLLLAAILNKEKEKRYKTAKDQPQLSEKDLEQKTKLTEEELNGVVSSEAKKRKESIFEFGKGKRIDLVEKEKQELEILQKYLPEQLSPKEIEKLVKEVINEIGAKDLKDIGRVMAELMPKVKGKTEGGVVSKIVKEFLSAERE